MVVCPSHSMLSGFVEEIKRNNSGEVVQTHIMLTINKIIDIIHPYGIYIQLF